MVAQYELITYDLWGNWRDGWQVNDAFRTGIIIELINPDIASNRLINRKLQAQGVLWEGDPEFALCGVNKSGKPIAQLRRIEQC